MNKNKEGKYSKDYFESKDRKIEVNAWRKLINVIFAVITLYLLIAYNIFDYTGNIIGFLLVIVWGVVINYSVKKTFSFFTD